MDMTTIFDRDNPYHRIAAETQSLIASMREGANLMNQHERNSAKALYAWCRANLKHEHQSKLDEIVLENPWIVEPKELHMGKHCPSCQEEP